MPTLVLVVFLTPASEARMVCACFTTDSSAFGRQTQPTPDSLPLTLASEARIVSFSVSSLGVGEAQDDGGSPVMELFGVPACVRVRQL